MSATAKQLLILLRRAQSAHRQSPTKLKEPSTYSVNAAMAAVTAPEDEAGCRQLLLEASSTLLQMATIARMNNSDADIKVFYSHLAFNCSRIHDLLKASIHLDGGVAHRILERLASLIPEGGLHEMPYGYRTADRLGTLKFHWNIVRGLRNTEQLDFISRWLRPKSSAEEREGLDRAFEDCVDEISKRQPRQRSQSFEVELTVKGLDEPRSAVRTAAQSSFDALHNCKKCICSCAHNFGVKLELGTYRQPPRPSKARASQYHYKDKTAEGLDFEVFLCMERNWHEVGIHAVGTRVGFNLPGEEDLNRRKKNARTRKKVEILCKEITRMKSKPGQRLKLELTEDQLFDMGFEKTKFNIEDPAEDVSLIQCIKEHQQCFTERTKRILYLIIGNTVLHLHNTSWLQPDWGSAHIKFFRAASSEIPLRPFIEARLDDRTADLDDERDDKDAFYHPCPVLVSLAVVLLELYFVKPFNELAKEQNVDLIEHSMGRTAVIDLDQVYYGVEEGGGCESQIPEDSRGLRVAIESCISGGLWEDEGNAVDRDTLRSRIYQNVVKPLETHLSHGFSQIPLESIDEHAKTIDLAHRGRFITCKGSDGWPGIVPSSFSTPGQALRSTILTPSRSPAIQPGAHLTEPESYSQPSHHHSVAHVTPDPIFNWDSDVGEKTADLFDDEIGNEKNAAKYDAWKDQYEEVYQKCIEKHLSNHSANTPVRIAVLDTGIEVDHPLIQAHNELKAMRNCYEESRKDLPDTHGHGTFVTNVILDFAPDAHLYVIKITDKDDNSLDARIVKNAIDHAVYVWHVDIISMSFGWPSSEFDGYEDFQGAIDRAYSKQVLMFAAASNSGGNLGRAYPASSSHVICVHSTDTLGNRSVFSPTEERDRVNIAKVGDSIRSAWPSSLRKTANDKDGLASRSGTSYATPILAGIAAFLLQYARLHLSEKEVMKMRRKENMEALLRRCAERGPNYSTRDGYYYVELSLHKHNMFGQDLDFINMCILQALKS